MARPRRKPGSTAPGGSPRRGRRGKGPFTDAGKGRIGDQEGRPQHRFPAIVKGCVIENG